MRLIALGLAALGFATCAPAAEPSAALGQIDWRIERDGTSPDGSRVMLNVRSHWGKGQTSMWGHKQPIAELQGLTGSQVAGPSGPVRFAIVREAGRLDCSGSTGRLTGKGSCSFTADPGFTDYLGAQGIGRPTVRQSFTLAMSKVGRELVGAIDALDYPRPTIDQLASMGVHGVDSGYLRGLAAIGPHLRRFTADDLVSMRIHGVKPDYVRAMAVIGPAFDTLTARDLVSFAIHGAKPEMVQAFVRHGRMPLQPEGVTAMAIHGVTAEFIEELASLGYKELTSSQLVQFRLHGAPRRELSRR